MKKKYSQFCETRVWDNGDMMDCGRKAVHAERCPAHLREEIRETQKSIREHQKEIDKLQARLDELQNEDVATLLDRRESRV